jgi:hypothetical protein
MGVRHRDSAILMIVRIAESRCLTPLILTLCSLAEIL